MTAICYLCGLDWYIIRYTWVVRVNRWLLKSWEWMITRWETETGCRIRREEHLRLSFKVKERSITGQLQTLMLTVKQECIDSSNKTLLFKIWQFHKESAWNSGDPGLGRSLGEGNGNPLLNYRNFIIKTVATHKKSKISTTPYIPIPTWTHTKWHILLAVVIYSVVVY